MKKQIIIDINKNGSINIEAVNFSGGECEHATAPFEDLFGITEEKTYKPEFYETAKVSDKLHNKW